MKKAMNSSQTIKTISFSYVVIITAAYLYVLQSLILQHISNEHSNIYNNNVDRKGIIFFAKKTLFLRNFQVGVAVNTIKTILMHTFTIVLKRFFVPINR